MTISAPIPPAMLIAATESILAKDGWTPDFPTTPPSDVRENAEARANAALAAAGYGELVAALESASRSSHYNNPRCHDTFAECTSDACKKWRQLLARVHGEADEGKR